jgi:hypothetical protein
MKKKRHLLDHVIKHVSVHIKRLSELLKSLSHQILGPKGPGSNSLSPESPVGDTDTGVW